MLCDDIWGWLIKLTKFNLDFYLFIYFAQLFYVQDQNMFVRTAQEIYSVKIWAFCKAGIILHIKTTTSPICPPQPWASLTV